MPRREVSQQAWNSRRQCVFAIIDLSDDTITVVRTRDDGDNHVSRMLLRDVVNLRGFFSQFVPELRHTQYSLKTWDLYQRGVLYPETVLAGHFEHKADTVDMRSVMREIDDARDEEAARRVRMG